MSIILYKSGNTYKSPTGIWCEFQICNPFSFEHLLEDGWFLTPEEVELDEKKKKEEKEKEMKEAPEPEKNEDEDEEDDGESPEPEKNEPTEDELKEDAIREAAKAAGISNWYNKGIDKLTEELKTIKEL